GVVCYLVGAVVTGRFGYDGSLEAFGVHGAGGTVGALLTGVFASQAINPIFKDGQGNSVPVGLIDGNAGQLLNQAAGTAIAWILAIAGTLIILRVVDMLVGLRVTSEQEI